MARFFLNVRDGEALIRDPEAYQFATAQDARDATVRMVRAMLAERDDDFDGKYIEIADATGHPVAIVSRHDVMPERYH